MLRGFSINVNVKQPYSEFSKFETNRLTEHVRGLKNSGSDYDGI